MGVCQSTCVHVLRIAINATVIIESRRRSAFAMILGTENVRRWMVGLDFASHKQPPSQGLIIKQWPGKGNVHQCMALLVKNISANKAITCLLLTNVTTPVASS